MTENVDIRSETPVKPIQPAIAENRAILAGLSDRFSPKHMGVLLAHFTLIELDEAGKMEEFPQRIIDSVEEALERLQPLLKPAQKEQIKGQLSAIRADTFLRETNWKQQLLAFTRSDSITIINNTGVRLTDKIIDDPIAVGGKRYMRPIDQIADVENRIRMNTKALRPE